MPNPIPMTAEEIERLRAEMEDLKTQGRRRVREELAKALSYGDFTENAELDEAKRARAMLEGRIADLTQILGRAEVVVPGSGSCVTAGATIVACDLETMEEICLSVGLSAASEPAGRLVTPDSPMGRALMGKSVSDEVEVQTPSGTRRYRILSLTFPTRDA
jgi:transcription elongation factor GreA